MLLRMATIKISQIQVEFNTSPWCIDHLRRWYCSWDFCFWCNRLWCLSLMVSAPKILKKGQVKKGEAGLILDHLDWILLKYVWTLAFSCLCLCRRRDWGALWHFLCYLQVLTVRRTRRGRFTSNFRKASPIHINILAVSCVWIANSFLWNGQLNNPKVSKAVAKFSSKTITEHHSRQVDPA